MALVKAGAVTAAEWNFAVGPRSRTLREAIGDASTNLATWPMFLWAFRPARMTFTSWISLPKRNGPCRLKSKALAREWTFEKDLFHPIVSGTDVGAYGLLPSRQFILFPYIVREECARLMDFKDIQRDYRKTAAYLLENKKRLEGREKGRIKAMRLARVYLSEEHWHARTAVKLCVPRLVDRLHAAFDHDGSHFLDNVDVGGVTLKAAYAAQGLEYLLALLNCRLMRWYFPQVSAPFRGGWLSANRQFLSLLPVRVIDFANAADTAVHGQLCGLVGSMQTLHRQLAAAKSEAQKTVTQRQIDATGTEIDRLVYDLYGLTAEEIAVVENPVG